MQDWIIGKQYEDYYNEEDYDCCFDYNEQKEWTCISKPILSRKEVIKMEEKITTTIEEQLNENTVLLKSILKALNSKQNDNHFFNQLNNLRK